MFKFISIVRKLRWEFSAFVVGLVVVDGQFYDPVEVAHVFAQHEAGVRGLEFLVVDQSPQLVFHPPIVLHVCQGVLFAHEHRDGHLLDLGDVDRWGSLLAVLPSVLGFSVVIVSEAVVHQLAEVLQLLEAGSVREVARGSNLNVRVVEGVQDVA